jgi:hypothetical protein
MAATCWVTLIRGERVVVVLLNAVLEKLLVHKISLDAVVEPTHVV